MDLTSEDKQKMHNAIKDPNTTFVFIPSADMKNKIINKSDKILNQLPDSMIATILSLKSDQAIHLDKEVILKLIDNSIDEKNKHVFSQGEIRVLMNDLSIGNNKP